MSRSPSPRALVGALALAAVAGTAPRAGAQAITVPAPTEHPAAIGCWTVRADGVGRADGAEALGLPSHLRLDVGGDVLATRDGMSRRGSWRVDGDGALRATVPLASGATAAFELTRAEGEWNGQVRSLGESTLA